MVTATLHLEETVRTDRVSGIVPAGSVESDELEPGDIVGGRFQIDRLIGFGGMGLVYAAWQLDLDRGVAIKVLRPELANEPLAQARFEREARLAATMTSPHSIRVIEHGRLLSGQPYTVLELLDGTDLGAIVAQGPLPFALAVQYVLDAAEALAEAHARGIVHRDVKPLNLFVTKDATGEEHVKVLDYGLAKRAPRKFELQHTIAGQRIGSPSYMSPEQIRGVADVDARTDVWSLGVTLYMLVEGVTPFPGTNVAEILEAVCTAPFAPPQRMPPAVADVVSCALSKDRARRYADAGELRAALLRAVTPATTPRAPTPAPRRAALYALVAIVLVLATLLPSVAAVVVMRPPVLLDLVSETGTPADPRARLTRLGYDVTDERVDATRRDCALRTVHAQRGKVEATVVTASCTTPLRAAQEAQRRFSPTGIVYASEAEVLACESATVLEAVALCARLQQH